ncbi:MAG: AMP-binding protein, partial [Chloroflexota bacterium]
TFQLVHFLRRQGISGGERLAIAADNSLEWMVAYIACLLAGGVIVPLRPTLTPEMLRLLLSDSGAKMAILQQKQHLEALVGHLQGEEESFLPHLKLVAAINYEHDLPAGVIGLEQVLTKSPALTPEEQAAIQIEAANIDPAAPATIYYVASESGTPKGAVFDHCACLAGMRHIADWFKFEEDDLAFTLRPWSEAPSLLVSLHYFLGGVPNALLESYGQALENMQLTSPTILLTTPYSIELFYKSYMNWVNEQPEATQQVFQWAVAKGKEYRAVGLATAPELRQEFSRADMTFFGQFRGSIGGRMRRFYSTGASLAQELAEFFQVVGLPVLNIYSLTEAGGFITVSHIDDHHYGSCGKVAPGYEVRISADDEIQVRGDMVMRAYWQRPEETRQAFTPDGWLHTGDTGYFDDDGFLFITGRRQHMIVLSTGRKIAPAAIENALTASPFIAQAAVFGEGKPYVSAMILPNLQALADHFKRQENSDSKPVTSTGHPKVKELLDKVIGEVNNQLDRWEQVREYSLLEQPLSQEAGELTASARISRHVVAERYAAQIEAMYPVAIQFKEQDVTEVQVSPERLQALLEKENILDAWLADAGIQFLFDLARDKQIDAPSMVHISDAAATIAQMEAEEKPLSTALIIGDPVRIARTLPEAQVQLLRHDHIRRMRHILVTLAKMVDGLVLGYVIDKYGYVRGIHRLSVDLDPQPASFLLGPQFRHHAAISHHCDAVVFFVPSGGRQVRVFANGQLIGRYSNGDWSPENIAQVDRVVADLARRKQYDLALIRRVLRCAFQMSEENQGAIFIIGDADLILGHSDAPETSHFALIVSDDIAHLSDRELINFAKQDGATVIDGQGKFRGCMVLLRPDAATQAEIGPGKGARHSSAAKMSAEANCLAITVSQDGPITIYDSGQRVLSL